jgi:hypothetical protein
MTEGQEPHCRLYAILARDGRSAVVFRRGPSRQVRLLRWWLAGDTIEPGQWLMGRIYERRCDLSPDGELLVYFAAKWETPAATWTAISRPPYLTALAFWPKGDAWGGGGHFLGERMLGLNHGAVVPPIRGRGAAPRKPWHPLPDDTPDPMPGGLIVTLVADWAGHGEDSPIEDARLARDGWLLRSAGRRAPYGSRRQVFIEFLEPEVYERPSPHALANPIVLRRLLRAIGERNGRWNVEDFELCAADSTVVRALTGCNWADWQANGDLLFSIDGRLYRLPAAEAASPTPDPLAGARLIADLTAMHFEAVAATPEALAWP